MKNSRLGFERPAGEYVKPELPRCFVSSYNGFLGFCQKSLLP